MNNIFYVYIVRCSNNHFYTGYTDNLELRIKEHNGEGKYRGAKYTMEHRPVKLVHYEEYENKYDALDREKEIKKMDYAEKEVVVSLGNRLLT